MQHHKKSNHLLLWIVITILITICIGLFVWQSFSSDASTTANLNTIPPTSAVKSTSQAVQSPTTEIIASEAEAQSEVSTTQNTQTLVNSDINTQAIPNNPALQQEEIDKLKDIQNQLKNQQENLNEQHQDADKLIELKQAQIKLLEQQLKQQ